MSSHRCACHSNFCCHYLHTSLHSYLLDAFLQAITKEKNDLAHQLAHTQHVAEGLAKAKVQLEMDLAGLLNMYFQDLDTSSKALVSPNMAQAVAGNHKATCSRRVTGRRTVVW